MDNFVVSARKYRPQKFEDVVGQQSIANTLKLAIKNQKLASAYLFCGPRGVGKTTCARIFAKAINCLNPRQDGEACEECESCMSFNQQRSINIQELNAAANNSVEDIRAIIDQVRIPPQLGRYKVIILDEVHMLSTAAGNALLKTLEEPPSYVIFILATTEKHKIMQTILSRCQIFDFNRMEIADIVGNLKMVAQNEGIEAEDAALNVIAQKADGGMRDALSIFDQVSNYSQGHVTHQSVLQCLNALDYDYYFRMTDMLVQHNVVEAMLLFNEVVNKGFNGGVFIAGLASHFRDLLMSRDPQTLPLLNVAQSLQPRYIEQARQCSVRFLYHAIRSADRCANEYKNSQNKRLSVEITLIEAAQYSDDDTPGAGLGPVKIKQLKPIFKNLAPIVVSGGGNATATQTSASKENNKDTSVSKPTETVAAQNEVSDNNGQKNAASAPLRLLRPSLKAALEKAKESSASPAPQVQTAAKSQAQEPAQINNIVNETEVADIDSDNDASDEEQGQMEQAIPPFTIAQVEKQWTLCSQQIQAYDPPMASRMLGMPLSCPDEHTIVVSLHNEMVEKQFLRFRSQILGMMQEAFRMPELEIKTHILPQEIVRVITNPSELLKKMREEHPLFAQFVDDLELEL